ncbi:MAG: TOBE domain-containing protein [Rhodospirillaceae bacterium]|nr:MAG: TOBE domain-containing protein [Rhodospirillaceae bacterium]
MWRDRYVARPSLMAMLRLRPEQIISAGEGEGEGCAARVMDVCFRGDHAVVSVAPAGSRFGIRTAGAVESDWIRLSARDRCSIFAKAK